MDNQEQNNQTSSLSDDVSTVLPTLPVFRLSRTTLIIGGCILLVVLFASAHLLMKPAETSVEVVTETPNGNLVTITPPEGVPTNVPEIVKDLNGREYLTGELIVVFRASVPVEKAKEMIVGSGGVVKQHFTQFPVFLVGISDTGVEGVNRAILQFQTMQEVERAEPNYLTGKDTP